MPVMPVGLQLALVVCAPEAERDEPGVQQARVVRVLDVLLHELPVARNLLAVVAEDLEFAAVEQAVEVAQHFGSEEVFERLHVRVERSEHHAAAHRHLELVEAVRLGVEVLWHAAVDLALLLHAAAKRHALQVTGEGIAPLVVRADEILFVAMALTAELHAAVRADVLDDVDVAVRIAHQHHRAFADHRAHEVTGFGTSASSPDVAPMLAIEEAFELFLVLRIALVGHERDAAAAVVLPFDALRKIRGGCVHRCVLGSGFRRAARARCRSPAVPADRNS